MTANERSIPWLPWFLFASGLVVLLCGWLLMRDQPGLRAAHFALSDSWQGRPVNSAVTEPRITDVSGVGHSLLSPVAFSIRWRGWWHVDTEGEHRFVLDADDSGFLNIDGAVVVETSTTAEAREGRRSLGTGFHRVEIGLRQQIGDARLVVHWMPPGADERTARPLPVSDLHTLRPLFLSRLLRRVAPDWPAPYRHLLGALLALVGLSLSIGSLPRRALVGRLTGWRPRGRRLKAGLLIAIFLVSFLSIFPHTGSVRGGDDTSYLEAATFNLNQWFVNRYGHVYLLKLFTAVAGDDPIRGVRLWWSFVFATTVTALAAAVASVGPGLQWRTFALVLFVLFAQPVVFGLIGAGFADYSAMMFVTVATAVYVHGFVRERDRPETRHEWHAMAIGALTAAAFRCKETGAVLLLLPLLFALGDSGSLDLRRWFRRLCYWAAGLVTVLLGFMILDAWIVGDFFLTWDERRLANSRQMNFPAGVRPRDSSWTHNIWYGRDMRHLWLGVVIAAVVAAARRCRIQLRLLHLMPIAYLLALLVLYIRMPHPFSDRMLIPIVPVACLMTALAFHHAGLDRLPVRDLLRPTVLIPGGFLVALVFELVIPLWTGVLKTDAVLPNGTLQRLGWQPDQFALGVLAPVAVLVAVCGLTLVLHDQTKRIAALLVVLCAFFGVGFQTTRSSLSKGWSVQKSNLLVYPWRSFLDQLYAGSARRIVLSSDLRHFYRMSATTRTALARVSVGRYRLGVGHSQSLPPKADVAIASRYTYDDWRRQVPKLAESAVPGPNGFLVLVRPKAAIEATESPIPAPIEPADWGASVVDSLLRERGREAWNVQLRDLCDSFYAPEARHMRRLFEPSLSTRLRGINLTPDGWTRGLEPAVLLVDNRNLVASRLEVLLVPGIKEREVPFRVFLDDGEEITTITFEQALPRRIELPEVPPLSSRLLLIAADKAATAPSSGRQLGIRVLASPRGPEEP